MLPENIISIIIRVTLHVARVSLVLLVLVLTGCKSPAITLNQSVQGFYDSDLSQYGEFSLVASIHHGASLWRLSTAERLYNWNHQKGQYSQIEFVSLSLNGQTALTAFHQELVAWQGKTGEVIEFWQLPAPISCLDMDGTGRYGIVGMNSGQAMLIDTELKGFALTVQWRESITACHITAQADYLALGSQAGLAQGFSLLRTAHENEPPTFELVPLAQEIHEYGINHIHIMESSPIMLSASGHHEIRFTDLKSHQTLFVKPSRNGSITASTQAGEYLLIGLTNREIKAINTKNFSQQHILTIPKRNIWKTTGLFIDAIAYQSNRLIVSGSDGRTLFFNDITLK